MDPNEKKRRHIFYLKNKVKIQQYQKEWYKKNREKILTSGKRLDYTKLTTEQRVKIRETKKKWYHRTKSNRLDNLSDQRTRKLRIKYGISPKEYEEMHEKQKGVCHICFKPSKTKSGVDKRLSIDHDHQTGGVRGLLCSKCNLGLGLFEDNPELLKKAGEYLISTTKTQ